MRFQILKFEIAAFCLLPSAFCLLLLSCFAASAQSGRPAAPTPTPSPTPAALLARTTTRREVRRLGYGGQLTLLGAPDGSVTIEAWPRAEVEVVAEIEVRAPTEEDLARLASVNGFVLDENLNHLRLITTGTHDRKYMKRVARDFPKRLLSMPWKVDYRIRVPPSVDLDLYAGRGALTVSGVEGALRLSAGETTPASLTLTGGDVDATVTRGSVSLRVAGRGWRGRGAQVRLNTGDLTVELPADFDGDINADVLRGGRLENTFAALGPREGEPSGERRLRGRAGAGGATLTFVVGDGTLRIRQARAVP